jgi:hypothetical protein
MQEEHVGTGFFKLGMKSSGGLWFAFGLQAMFNM